jgi:hypothetical protein
VSRNSWQQILMQDAWRKLLIPNAGYEISDLWQVLVALPVLQTLWDAFKPNGTEIPFPQRDFYIKSSSVDFGQRDRPDPE